MVYRLYFSAVLVSNLWDLQNLQTQYATELAIANLSDFLQQFTSLSFLISKSSSFFCYRSSYPFTLSAWVITLSFDPSHSLRSYLMARLFLYQFKLLWSQSLTFLSEWEFDLIEFWRILQSAANCLNMNMIDSHKSSSSPKSLSSNNLWKNLSSISLDHAQLTCWLCSFNTTLCLWNNSFLQELC